MPGQERARMDGWMLGVAAASVCRQLPAGLEREIPNQATTAGRTGKAGPGPASRMHLLRLPPATGWCSDTT